MKPLDPIPLIVAVAFWAASPLFVAVLPRLVE